MAINTELKYASLDDLQLDPKNPRLGRHNIEANLSQDQILDLMKDWTLDELAVSFLESGFWPQEALLVVEEKLYKQPQLVVVEGNRRLAALKLLFDAKNGNLKSSKKWQEIASTGNPEAFKRLEKIPYLKADSRREIQAYLGFRHVTGIKEWDPAEKAEHIARLIDEHGMTYQQVMRQIGSKTPAVRQNYISYRLLLQMEEDLGEQISLKQVEKKFSVLYLSLRTSGVQKYLQIDIHADPQSAKKPVPPDKLQNLVDYALWLFGDDEREPVVTDSRLVDKFGKVLESADAVKYLKRSEHPIFETAYRLAGGDEAETIELIERAADNIRQALGTVHHFTHSKDMHKAVKRFGRDAIELLSKFPEIKNDLVDGDE
jgi:ParB-like chromosome segregation protein Spo0J